MRSRLYLTGSKDPAGHMGCAPCQALARCIITGLSHRHTAPPLAPRAARKCEKPLY